MSDSIRPKRKEFTEDTKLKCLLWSYRHCCLCDKVCGTDIEIAHTDKPEDNNIDNAIPLCYDCHAEISRYNDEHPRGNKYRPRELKSRRDQIYEKYTRHLVPPVLYKLNPVTFMDSNREKPRVGFQISHLGDYLPVKTTVDVEPFLGGESLGSGRGFYYSGKIKWHLNPRQTIVGNFPIKRESYESTKKFSIEIRVTLIDMYDRQHGLLPVCYTYVRKNNNWNLDPTSYKERYGDVKE